MIVRRVLIAISIAAAVFWTGCSKQNAKPVTAREPKAVTETLEAADAANADAPSTPAAPPPTVAAKKVPISKKEAAKQPVATDVIPREIPGEVHPFMTQQLRLFIQQKGRMPTTFAEFSGARMDSVPFPPKGKRYVIDAVTQTVKIVKE